MNIINVFALRGLVKPLFCLTSPLSNVAMLLRLDNSNLLSLEFNLWLCSKGTIWPSFVVPNAFFVVAMGPDFVPDSQMWKSSPTRSPYSSQVRVGYRWKTSR